MIIYSDNLPVWKYLYKNRASEWIQANKYCIAIAYIKIQKNNTTKIQKIYYTNYNEIETKKKTNHNNTRT